MVSIEIRHLRYFMTAAEQGSFRKAGVTLGIQASAISRTIRDLEDHLGASLFQRYNGGVFLTPAGQQFFGRTREALQQICDGARDVAAIGRSESGHIKVGIFTSLASGFLSDLLRSYSKDHPEVQIEFIHGDTSDYISSIRQLKMDIAFLIGNTEWAECITDPLWSERAFVVLPDGHSLTCKAEVSWDDLVGESFIVSNFPPGQEVHNYLVQRLADLGRHPDIRPQHVGRDNLFQLVALGHGLTVTSEAATATLIPGVSYRPISHETFPFSAVWSPKNDNPPFRRLLSLARSMAQLRNGNGLNLPPGKEEPLVSPLQNPDPSR